MNPESQSLHSLSVEQLQMFISETLHMRVLVLWSLTFEVVHGLEYRFDLWWRVNSYSIWSMTPF